MSWSSCCCFFCSCIVLCSGSSNCISRGSSRRSSSSSTIIWIYCGPTSLPFHFGFASGFLSYDTHPSLLALNPSLKRTCVYLLMLVHWKLGAQKPCGIFPPVMICIASPGFSFFGLSEPARIEPVNWKVNVFCLKRMA